MPTKRDDIIRAAAMLFAQKGVHGASVPQILQLANASAGAMYSYFESKRELADEVFRLAQQTFDEHVWSDFPSHLPQRAQLRELCKRYATFINEHVHYAALVMFVSDGVSAGKVHEELAALLESWQRAPSIHAPSTRSLSVIVHGAFVQLTRRGFASQTPLSEALFAEVEHYLWHAMTAPYDPDPELL